MSLINDSHLILTGHAESMGSEGDALAPPLIPPGKADHLNRRIAQLRAIAAKQAANSPQRNEGNVSPLRQLIEAELERAESELVELTTMASSSNATPRDTDDEPSKWRPKRLMKKAWRRRSRTTSCA